MNLLNGMTGDTNGGICLIKQYLYYEYNQEITGCTCSESYGVRKTGYTNTGMYITSYKNANPNYSINTTDNGICVSTNEIPITGWVETYINKLVTTGYTDNEGSPIEDRVIFDTSTGTTGLEFFRLDHETKYSGCATNTDPMWAISDIETNEVWNGTGDGWYYKELNDCNEETGYKVIYSVDINPNSPSYNQSTSVYGCVSVPILVTTAVTNRVNNTAMSGGNVIDEGLTGVHTKGICWSTSVLPTISNSKTTNTEAYASFTGQITGLTAGLTYHVRAYATNDSGTGYGNQISFIAI